MFIYMIFASMIGGVLVGFFRLLPKKYAGSIHRLIFISLMGMLLALGAQVGSSAEVLGKMGSLGWKSFVISMLSMAGSAFALWLMDRFWPIRIDPKGGKKP